MCIRDRNLLDNTGQSFFSFGADLIISEEYSSGCVQLFGEKIGGKKFMDIIEKHVPNDVKRTVLSLLGDVFSSSQTLQQKIYLSLMPNEISVHDKTIRIDYNCLLYTSSAAARRPA